MPMIIREPQQKTIAVDLDQTLVHTLDALVSWHNQTHNTNYTASDFDTLDFHKVWGGTSEEACAKLRAFYESEHFEAMRPIRDFALEALKMLKKRKFTLVIITSRQQFIAGKTKKFVDRHYPGIFESIYFCNLGLSKAEQLEYVSKPKSLVCKEIGAHVLIDDSLIHALDCAKLGIQVLLYDRKGQYKWNHLKSNPTKMTPLASKLSDCPQLPSLPSNIRRVSNWQEIMASFPKPTSPLRMCHFPEDLAQDDPVQEEVIHEEVVQEEIVQEQIVQEQIIQEPIVHEEETVEVGYEYETIEIDELSDDEELYQDRTVWV